MKTVFVALAALLLPIAANAQLSGPHKASDYVDPDWGHPPHQLQKQVAAAVDNAPVGMVDTTLRTLFGVPVPSINARCEGAPRERPLYADVPGLVINACRIGEQSAVQYLDKFLYVAPFVPGTPMNRIKVCLREASEDLMSPRLYRDLGNCISWG